MLASLDNIILEIFVQVKSAGEAESDDKEDARTRSEIKLYRCSDAEGTLKITEVNYSMLIVVESGTVFFIENMNSSFDDLFALSLYETSSSLKWSFLL